MICNNFVCNKHTNFLPKELAYNKLVCLLHAMNLPTYVFSFQQSLDKNTSFGMVLIFIVES